MNRDLQAIQLMEAAIDLPPDERDAFVASIDSLGYSYWDETENLAYQLYLGQRSD